MMWWTIYRSPSLSNDPFSRYSVYAVIILKPSPTFYNYAQMKKIEPMTFLMVILRQPNILTNRLQRFPKFENVPDKHSALNLTMCWIYFPLIRKFVVRGGAFLQTHCPDTHGELFEPPRD